MRDGTRVTRDAEQVASEVQGLRDELEAARLRTVENGAALEDLGRQQDAAAGRLELSRRQAVEYMARLEEREAELEELRRQEAAYETFRAALRSRDAAGVETAAAIDAVLNSFAAFVGLQEAVAASRAAVPPRFDVSVSPEPEELVEAWQRMVEFVRTKIDEQLMDEVVEGAARSVAGYDIGKLPEHLQAIARVRRRQFLTTLTESKSTKRTTSTK